MKSLLPIISLIFVSFSAAHAMASWEPNCPTTSGEGNRCEYETLETINALKKLEQYSPVTEKVYSYCLTAFSSPGQTGLQCRTLSLFYKADGTVIKDIFIDRFIGHESWRSHTYTTYMVATDSTHSTYNRHVDHMNEGNLVIDQHRVSKDEFGGVEPANTFTSDAGIPVIFSVDEQLPSFPAYYFNDTHTLIYRPSQAYFTSGLKVYNVLNEASTQTIESQDDWTRFFTKEGIPNQ